jgi:hypothetical protein
MARLIDTVTARYRPQWRTGQHKPRPQFKPDDSEAARRRKLLREAGILLDEITERDLDGAEWLRDSFRLGRGDRWEAIDADGEWHAPSDDALARVAEQNRPGVLGAVVLVGGAGLLASVTELVHAADTMQRDRRVTATRARCTEMAAERDVLDLELVEQYATTGAFPPWWRPGLRAQAWLRRLGA